MKVLLVNPPLGRLLSANLPTFVEEERGSYPPIGLLSIAASLRARAGGEIEVAVLDAALEGLDDAALGERLRRERPDVLGVQALTFTLLDALGVVAVARSVLPGVTVVLGGRHCDLYPAETAALPGVDYVLSGEGELAFPRLLERLGSPERT